MLIKEYSSKTTLPVPLLLFELIYKLLVHLINKLDSSDAPINLKRTNDFRLEELQVIRYFENQSSNKMIANIESRLNIGETVSCALKSIDEQQGRLADLKIVFQAVERQIDKRFCKFREQKFSSQK